jgi:hypothetical protein
VACPFQHAIPIGLDGKAYGHAFINYLADGECICSTQSRVNDDDERSQT